MSVNTIVRISDPARNGQQRTLSERVISFFTLPQVPLLVFLDDTVSMEIRDAIGPEN